MRYTAIVATIVLAGAALAHSGVTNPSVKARMHLMGQIKDATGTIGDMIKGKRAFNAAEAEIARKLLITHSSEIAGKFEANETEPKSEALPKIWTDWEDFVLKAEAMGKAADAMDTTTKEAMAVGMGMLAKSCSGCHKLYRIEK